VTGVTVRTEEPGDERAVGNVVAAAFGSEVEARLVEAIRASANFVREWSLVAVLADRIVGHVMVSYVSLEDDGRRYRVPSLSPLAVAPERQRQGIGGALVRAVVGRVDAAGEPLVVLEGSPVYYARFGFEPAPARGVTITLPEWAPPEAAQVLPLRAYDAAIRGHVVYPPAFDPVEDR
jgi:putative acetyltransferase